MSLNVTEKLIDASMAKAIIEGHENYRTITARRVNAYAEEMKRGEWGLSILIFDEDGTLVDGQSRLTAVIKSGAPQRFACVSGWPADQVVYLDNGQNRTKSQVAKAERGVTNGNKVMSMVCRIEDPFAMKCAAVLNSTALRLYDKYGECCEDVMRVAMRGQMGAAVHMVAFARCIYLYPETKDTVLAALEKINALDFASNDMSGLKLYYKWAIERGFTKGGGNVMGEAYKRCARALVAYLRNEYLTKLYCPATDPLLDYGKK